MAKPLSAAPHAVLQGPGADVAELVDARDLKSLGSNPVRVRFPAPAPIFARFNGQLSLGEINTNCVRDRPNEKIEKTGAGRDQ